MKQRFLVFFSCFLLFLGNCLQAETKSNQQEKLKIIYIHGALNSSKEREKAYPKEAHKLHRSFQRSLAKTTPISNYQTLEPVYFYAEWLQDKHKANQVLDRLTKEIRQSADPFLIMSHSAGSLVAYDYLSRRMSLFPLKEKIVKVYKLDAELAQELPEFYCQDLIEKYDPVSTEITAQEINFLKEAFNNVSIDLVKDDFKIAQNLIKQSYDRSKEEYLWIKKSAASPVCKALLPEIKSQLDSKAEIKSFFESRSLFHDSLVLARKKQVEQIQKIKESLSNFDQLVIELAKQRKVRAKYLVEEENGLKEHFKNQLLTEEITLESLNRILGTKPGNYSQKTRTYTQKLVDNLLDEHQKICVDRSQFVGLVTFGSSFIHNLRRILENHYQKK